MSTHAPTILFARVSPRTAVLAGLALLIALLVVAALLTPEQNPILPIEISLVLAGIGAWVGIRGSRAALVATTVVAALLSVLSAHILAGDLGIKGPRELVPDVLMLLVSVATAGSALVGARRVLRHS